MSRFRLLTENFFNVRQFSGHTIAASTYQVGNEPWRVGTGRRLARNAWVSPSTGTQYLTVACDQVRAADMLAIDRGYNAVTLSIEFTNSTAAGWTVQESVTLPTATQQNFRLSDTPGVFTPEGAWLYRFASTSNMPAATNWRLGISLSTGSGHKVVGAYLGRSFSPTKSNPRPWDDGAHQLLRAEVASPELWTVGSRVAKRREGSLTARLERSEEAQAIYHVRNLFDSGELGWVVPDEDAAENAVLATSPNGGKSLPYTPDWPGRTVSLDWVEYQPL